MKTYIMTACIEDETLYPYPLGFSYDPEKHLYPFRLVDDGGEVMGYGLSNDANNFHPLDDYQGHWGCTAIEYLNPVSKIWEAI